MTQIKDYLENYLKYLKFQRHASDLTIRNYTHYLRRFLDYLLSHYPTLTDPSKITAAVINNYKAFIASFKDRQNNLLDPRTQGYHLIAIRSFLKYLISQGINTIHREQIEVPKGKTKEITFLDTFQVNNLLRLAENFRDRSILELLISTGVRVSDLVRLDKENINFLTDEVSFKKGNEKIRKCFLTGSASYWLKKYLADRNDLESALFIRTAGKKSGTLRLTARSIQRIMEKYVKKAGFGIKPTPHSLRHTYAISILSEGKPLSALKQLLGHKNISTTQIYTHVTNPQLRDIHKKFHHRLPR